MTAGRDVNREYPKYPSEREWAWAETAGMKEKENWTLPTKYKRVWKEWGNYSISVRHNHIQPVRSEICHIFTGENVRCYLPEVGKVSVCISSAIFFRCDT
jgi:hypothetical protein